MQKIFICAHILLSMFFFSCSSDTEQDSLFFADKDISVSVEDYRIMSFASIEEFDAMADSLSTLSKEELASFRELYNPKSLYDLYISVINEYDFIETESDFQNLVKKYSDILVFNFNDPEDYSVYCPVDNIFKAMLLNKSGKAMIGGHTFNGVIYTSKNYPFIKDDSQITRSGNTDIQSGINEIFVLADHRKLFVDFQKFSDSQAAYNVKTKRRILGGWYEYDSTVYFEYPGGYESFDSHGSCTVYKLLPPNGLRINMWSDGVGSANKATMTISY